MRVLVALVGGAGFVALLVASARLPHRADALRLTALLWFAIAGAVWAFTADEARRR